jgi:hypothetical protein
MIKEMFQLVACINKLADILQECADDLSTHIDEEYKTRDMYREQSIKYNRDMEVVTRAIEAIAQARSLIRNKVE